MDEANGVANGGPRDLFGQPVKKLQRRTITASPERLVAQDHASPTTRTRSRSQPPRREWSAPEPPVLRSMQGSRSTSRSRSRGPEMEREASTSSLPPRLAGRPNGTPGTVMGTPRSVANGTPKLDIPKQRPRKRATTVSAQSTPLLPKELRQLEFVVTAAGTPVVPASTASGSGDGDLSGTEQGRRTPSQLSGGVAKLGNVVENKKWTLETKHAGPASLKRIVIGPHLMSGHLGPSYAEKKSRIVDPGDTESSESEGDGEHTSSSGSGSEQEEDYFGGFDPKVRRKLSRMRRGSSGKLVARDRTKQGEESRAAWHQMLNVQEKEKKRTRVITRAKKGPKTKKGVKSVHGMDKWMGGSFEVGGDVREAWARMNSATYTPDGSLRAKGKEKEEIDSFATATTSPLPLEKPRETYNVRQPPRHVEEQLPELVHSLLRRPSDPPTTPASVRAPTTPARVVSPFMGPETPALTTPTTFSPAFTPQMTPSAAGSRTPSGVPKSILKTRRDLTSYSEGDAASVGRARASTFSFAADGGGLLGSNGQANGALPRDELRAPRMDHPNLSLPTLAIPERRVRSVQLPPPPALPPSSSSEPRVPTLKPIKTPTKQFGPHTADRPPAPVEQVLARLRGPSTAESVNSSVFSPVLPKEDFEHGVVRKERMLVRAEWTIREDLPDAFNETSARKFTSHLHPEPWEEYGLVWRAGQLEFWSEHVFGFDAVFTNRKKLKHIVPLVPNRTRLSLYSSSDLIFCLTHRPTRTHDSVSRPGEDSTSEAHKIAPRNAKAQKRAILHFRHDGTNIYLIRARSDAVAKEWMWELYLQLGGSVPRVLDIDIPGLGVKIQVPMPRRRVSSKESQISGSSTVSKSPVLGLDPHDYALLKPSTIVRACIDKLVGVQDWTELVTAAEREGVAFKLAWRRGSILDWVREDQETIKAGGVFSGHALRQPNLESFLELRPALHYPTTVKFPGVKGEAGVRLAEPPGIEGYLHRVRPNGVVERVYLTSHDSHLFFCHRNPHPPKPPPPLHHALHNPAAIVLAPFVLGFASIGQSEKSSRKKLQERFKLGQFMSRSDLDIADKDQPDAEDTISNDIGDLFAKFEREEKQRLIEQIMGARGFVDLRNIEEVCLGIPPATTGQPAADEHVKKRSFYIRLTNSRVLQLQCMSPNVAKEWVGRLTSLMKYWRRRDRVDAMEQMELQPDNENRIREALCRANRGEARYAEDYHDPEEPPPSLLGSAFNWCVLDSCRTIVRTGIVYVRKTLSDGLFKERYCFLIGSHLLFYQTKRRNVHGKPVDEVMHRRKGEFSLRDCYVFTGRLSPFGTTSATVQSGTNWDPVAARSRRPRIYSDTDGLMTSDEDDDCTLIIWQKKLATKGFGKNGRIRVIRTRSMVERDMWIYSLNAAIERIHKKEREREDALKKFDWLPDSTPSSP